MGGALLSGALACQSPSMSEEDQRALEARVAASVAASLASQSAAPISGPSAPVSAAPSRAPQSAAPMAPVSAAANPPGPSWTPPKALSLEHAADRVFSVRTPDGEDWLLGADGDALWLVHFDAQGAPQLRWRVQGEGVAQRVALGDLGEGVRLYVAWGLGRGHLQAPLKLQAHDVQTGEAELLWRTQGARNECAHLSIADVNGDGRPDLAFAYYADKYHVRTHHILSQGQAEEGPQTRMASSRFYADLDGDGRVDEIVGRVYGDALGQAGDLTVYLHRAQGPLAVAVPTHNGVRALTVAQLAGDARPTLYFADGWVSDYGKRAQARVQRARWNGRDFDVQLLSEQPDEFTFFELTPADLRGDGEVSLVAQGSRRVSILRAQGENRLKAEPWVPLDAVLNTALVRTASGPQLAVPGRAVRLYPLP